MQSAKFWFLGQIVLTIFHGSPQVHVLPDFQAKLHILFNRWINIEYDVERTQMLIIFLPASKHTRTRLVIEMAIWNTAPAVETLATAYSTVLVLAPSHNGHTNNSLHKGTSVDASLPLLTREMVWRPKLALSERQRVEGEMATKSSPVVVSNIGGEPPPT